MDFNIRKVFKIILDHKLLFILIFLSILKCFTSVKKNIWLPIILFNLISISGIYIYFYRHRTYYNTTEFGKENFLVDVILGFLVYLILLAVIIVISFTRAPENKYSDVYSISSVLSHDKCEKIIAIAEDYAKGNGWMTKRHNHYPTTDLPVYSIKNHTIGSKNEEEDFITWVNRSIIDKFIFPHLEKLYKVPRSDESNQFMEMQDLFIVKYDATSKGAQRRLEEHKDSSQISFNIALNQYEKDYRGGGTLFTVFNRTVYLKEGDILLHPSRLHHSGRETVQGIRYILVGFVKIKRYFHDQLYWRLFGDMSWCMTSNTIARSTNTLDHTSCVSPMYIYWYEIYFVIKELLPTLSEKIILLGCICVLLLLFIFVVGYFPVNFRYEGKRYGD